MNKITIAVILVLALAGSAYYEFFYLPPTYSKAILGVIKEFETADRDIPRPEGASDSANKLIAIKKQSDFLKQAKHKISGLHPPLFGELRQFHNDILAMIDHQLESYFKQEEKIAFFGGILETRELFKPKNFDEKTARAKDVQKYFEDALPKVEARVDEILRKEPSFEFKNVTFIQLKSAWEEAKPGFTVWLSFIKRIDPEQRLDTSPTISPTQNEQAALAKINKFSELVEKAAASNVQLSQLSPEQDAESSARGQRIEKTIEELTKKYGQ